MHKGNERNFAAEYIKPASYASHQVNTTTPIDAVDLCATGAAEHARLSRRGFVGLGVLSVAAATVLGTTGCASPKKSGDQGSQEYKAGTYTATEAGRNGDITVKATFSTSALEALDTDHEESRNIGTFAIDTLTQQCLTGQTLNLDAISGATLTSMAFTKALEDVFQQAGGNVTALKKAAPGAEAAADIDETADVAIVGTGGAALAAAVTAAEAGASVVMLDKMDVIGGNTNAGEGTLNAPDPERQEAQGVEDSVEHFYTDTYEGGDEKGDPALVHILTENALDAVHFMEDHGLVYENQCFTAIGGKWCRGHAVEVEKKGEQGGSYYVSVLRSTAEKLGVKIYGNAKVDTILEEGGKVVGVSGSRRNGAKVQVRAKSVVMATGGYARNPELASQFDKRVTSDMPSSNVSSSTGDGIVMGQAIGADLANMELVQIHPLGDPQNGGVATFVGNWLGVEDYMMVNDEAKRFINEDGRRDEIANAILEQPNKEMWLLVDSTNIASDRASQIDELVDTGHSYRCESVTGLADKINVPADELQKTVDRYNGFIVAKNDEDFGKKLLGSDGDNSYQLTDAPYYASKRVPTIHYTMGGLKINTDAQVINTSGAAIENLYACGECTGGVQGSNRLGGNSYTDLIVFGRIAGANAAKNARA
ncbi:flavocytochrome c [Cryptobacterium curtum]|uniref:flavocytochrome c n=1 Tax=Cryptobacterium curtum TaxID=84163 RepID=UPI00248E413C|nr:flavocytochrome c [Cryptobacterium curtum]